MSDHDMRPVERWRARTDQTDDDTTPEPKGFRPSHLRLYTAFACGFVTGVLVCSVLASLTY